VEREDGEGETAEDGKRETAEGEEETTEGEEREQPARQMRGCAESDEGWRKGEQQKTWVRTGGEAGGEVGREASVKCEGGW